MGNLDSPRKGDSPGARCASGPDWAMLCGCRHGSDKADSRLCGLCSLCSPVERRLDFSLGACLPSMTDLHPAVRMSNSALALRETQGPRPLGAHSS